MTGNQCSRSSTFYTKISRRTIQISRRFPGGFINSRRFPGVVDTLHYEAGRVDPGFSKGADYGEHVEHLLWVKGQIPLP